jgi:hypothetical protein
MMEELGGRDLGKDLRDDSLHNRRFRSCDYWTDNRMDHH